MQDSKNKLLVTIINFSNKYYYFIVKIYLVVSY